MNRETILFRSGRSWIVYALVSLTVGIGLVSGVGELEAQSIEPPFLSRVLNAEQPLVDLYVGYRNFDLAGTVEHNDNGTVDMENDLSITSAGAPVIGIRFQEPNRSGFRLQYASFKFEGSGQPENGFTYGGETFNSTSNLSTMVRLKVIDFEWLHSLVPLQEKDRLNIKPGVRILDYEVKVSDGTNQAKREFVPISPVIGAEIRRFFTPRFYLEGDWLFSHFTVNDRTTSILDWSLFGGLDIARDWRVQVGYRDYRYDWSFNDEDHIDQRYRGLETQVLMRF